MYILYLAIASMFATISHLLALGFAVELLGAGHLLLMQAAAAFLLCDHKAL